MKRFTLGAVVLAFLVVPVAAAQDANGGLRTVELDLAGGNATYLVDPGQVDLVAVHALPDESYSVRVERRSGALLPAFELTKAFSESALSDHCESAIDSLAPQSEEELLAKVAALRRSQPDCRGDIDKWVAEQTRRPVQGSPFALAPNEALIVEIERNVPDKRSWTFEITTGGERRWLVHYGFSFLPSQDEDYFAKAGDDGTFVVTREADRDESDFEPTVAFTYQPNSLRAKPWKPAFVAGLGADIEERLVFAGISFVIGDNVAIMLGAAGHEQRRLKGNLREGQVLEELLTADQLHDGTFDLNAIVGIGLRFDKNPFSSKKEAGTATSAQPTASGQGTDENGETPTGSENEQPAAGAETPVPADGAEEPTEATPSDDEVTEDDATTPEEEEAT
jgi:hypothetical protein